MSLILTGTLASDLIRMHAVTHERLSAMECDQILRASYPSESAVAAIFASLHGGPAYRVFAQNGLANTNSDESTYPQALEVLVFRHTHVQRMDNVEARYYSAPLPAGSLLRVKPEFAFGADAFVTEPALTWLLASSRCDSIGALMIGMEMCGVYAEQPHGATRYDCVPATTPEQLRSRALAIRDAARSHRLAGWRGIEFALPYLLAHSASPMETKAAITLSLPISCGGWGIPGLSLNHRIDLTRDQQAIAGKPYLVIDGCLVGNRLGYEYDSDEFHTGTAKIERDRLRATAAQCLGMTLLSLTRDVIEDEVRFAAFCDEFSRLAGKRHRKLGARTLSRRLALRRRLGLHVQCVALGANEDVPIEVYEALV